MVPGDSVPEAPLVPRIDTGKADTGKAALLRILREAQSNGKALDQVIDEMATSEADCIGNLLKRDSDVTEAKVAEAKRDSVNKCKEVSLGSETGSLSSLSFLLMVRKVEMTRRASIDKHLTLLPSPDASQNRRCGASDRGQNRRCGANDRGWCTDCGWWICRWWTQ